MHPLKEAQQLPASIAGTAAKGDVTMALQPGAPAPILLPTCQTPSSPQHQGWGIIKATSFPFQVTGKNEPILALLEKLEGLGDRDRYQQLLG